MPLMPLDNKRLRLNKLHSGIDVYRVASKTLD